MPTMPLDSEITQWQDETTTPCRVCQKEHTPTHTKMLKTILTSTVCDECAPTLDEWFYSTYKRHGLWWEDNCPPAFKETELKRMPQSQTRTVREWNPKSATGLILHGVTGTCKTRALWMLLQDLSKTGIRPVYYAADELSTEIKRVYMQKGGVFELMDRLTSCPVLVIDDLGKERITADYQSKLWTIIRERTDNRLPMLITTNFTGPNLTARFEDAELADPLLRRLRENCQSVHFTKNIQQEMVA